MPTANRAVTTPRSRHPRRTAARAKSHPASPVAPLLAHPGVVTLFATRPALTSRNLRELEGLLRILTTAGFAAGTALAIVHATASSVLGQHLTKQGENSGDPVPGSADLLLVNEALEAGFPGVDARVGFTLTALVTGYESLL
ncbi:TetR/AcrR family transcriptional regulator C-terminal domain-containing protein [Nocardiopsis sp. M1B1]|uniref:TetR/AcrR family transcriptional regulator C-terminal domain-containing protein n=1 Tax=Nocardiopsis sp. M1B1 TaxID=3450454 RepID=UPI00403903EA